MFLKDEIKEIKERQKHFIDYSAHWDDINILIKEINKRIETKDKIKPIQNYDITPDEDLEK